MGSRCKTSARLGSARTKLSGWRTALEFAASGECGSCREFSPTWTKLENVAKNIATTKVNIDEPDGMEFAKKLGVLEEGLPNIRLFTSTAPDHKGVSVLPGMPEPYKKILKKVKGILSTGLAKRDDGMFVKSN